MSLRLPVVLQVEFAKRVNTASETSGFVSVILSLSGGTSTNDITVTVVPSDQSPVSAEGKIVISQTTS